MFYILLSHTYNLLLGYRCILIKYVSLYLIADIWTLFY